MQPTRKGKLRNGELIRPNLNRDNGWKTWPFALNVEGVNKQSEENEWNPPSHHFSLKPPRHPETGRSLKASGNGSSLWVNYIQVSSSTERDWKDGPFAAIFSSVFPLSPPFIPKLAPSNTALTGVVECIALSLVSCLRGMGEHKVNDSLL